MTDTYTRYEKKYLLTVKQKELFLEKAKEYIKADEKFSWSNIRSIYYDTDGFRLINRSIEKQEYKEKLRIRSYKNIEDDNESIFVEIKKKYDGVVYKRRTKAIYKEIMNDINLSEFRDKQIGNELRYMLSYYPKLKPKIQISCKRYSYSGINDKTLRITFDENIKYRFEELNLKDSTKDRLLTEYVVMEIKIKDAMPLWLTKILDEIKAYPRGFSKVGTAYLKEIKNYGTI